MNPRIGRPDTFQATSREGGGIRFERTYEEEVAIALSAMDCLLSARKGVYASSELTSGRRAQQLLREHRLANLASLLDHLGPEQYHALLWTPNVQAAIAFAKKLRRDLGPGESVISPAPFTAPGWSQAAYHTFWETVIRTRIKAIYFNDGWEYSNGCVHEFAVAADVGIAAFDSAARPLLADQAVERISHALRELQASGFDSGTIRSSLERIRGQPGG